ncbi:phosphoribosyltransferase family protein [Actinocorallia sp. A-T 12471]|uniref:phosphoribosyltransferase family protein n=1 Tax=Actinocorallia sp. A-T 12471 TaxID=3089813 RepID=UPI0029D3B4C1|nr:phosphoribosyltransferase family protein [Actinocorallia sp. A-T 12471]MDX6744707.1 phosphoribosyltransferase family protein [Actinocorallia sp. A-T 12471]
MSGPVWSGEWVSARLGLGLVDHASPVGLGLGELVGLAVRRNPRRAHLLVSTVLGKHVPTDPRIVYGAALLLGRLVGDVLSPSGEVDEVALRAGALLRSGLAGSAGAAGELRDLLVSHAVGRDAVVLGYAETATALGHGVADALGQAPYLHSTRRPVAGVTPYGAFEEEHSHATSHLLLPDPPGLLDTDVPLVLVDDELSTGRTVRNTLRALHAVRPRSRYVVASLIDLRDAEDRAATSALADELGARVDVVALAEGAVLLPPGVLEAGAGLVASLDPAVAAGVGVARSASEPGGGFGAYPARVALGWPEGVPSGGRHGFAVRHREALDKALAGMAVRVAEALPAGASRVLVLGFEELMYAPLRLAEALADLLPGVAVRYSTTTRSPVLAVADPGYAIRGRIAFPAHDAPADGPGERYAYNVDQGFDAVVAVVDEAGDTPALHEGLLAELGGLTGRVVLAVVPS